MSIPPPLPPPKPRRRTTLLLCVLLAITCIGAAIYHLSVTLAPVFFPPAVKEIPPSATHAEPIALPLRKLDVDKLAAQYLDRQDYFRRIDAATLAEYDRANAPAAPWYAEGRQAARLMALFAVWNDFYGQGILQACDAHAAAAWKKGCRDPLIRSICDIYTFQCRHSTTAAGAQSHIGNARDLNASRYPALLKLLATGMVLKDLIYSRNNHKDLEAALAASWAEEPKFVPDVSVQFAALLKEDAPVEMVFLRASDLFDRVQEGACLLPIGNEIEAVFAHDAPEYPARAAIRGDFLMTWAWQARGTGWANTVTEEGWRQMANRLDQANRTLTAAWDKNPGDDLSATVMIGIELGQGNGRDVMETWFRRAMKDHPNNFKACSSKMWYLQPRWYGSGDAVVEFGLQCMKTENWRAKLPLVLTGGIRDIADQQEDLYRNDKVWALVAPVYEGFLERYPDSIGVRTEYADCAAKGGRKEVLQAQLKKLGDDWDRQLWSSQDFRRISLLAKAP